MNDLYILNCMYMPSPVFFGLNCDTIDRILDTVSLLDLD